MSNVYQRNITSHIVDLMGKFPALAIIGARQVGKIVLAKAVGRDFIYVDLEKPSDYDRVTRDPEFFLNKTHQTLFLMKLSFIRDYFQF